MKKNIFKAGAAIMALLLFYALIIPKEYLYSMFDDVVVVRDRNKTPEGFEISPDKADRICFFIYPAKSENEFKAVTETIYRDDQSYFLMQTKSEGIRKCSYNARKYGVRINGKDGSVYNPLTSKWVKRGYVNITVEELEERLKPESTLNSLTDEFGIPAVCSSPRYPNRIEKHYMCTNGCLYLFFSDDKKLEAIRVGRNEGEGQL